MPKITQLALVAAVALLAGCELMTEVCTLELGRVVDPTEATIEVGETFQVEAHGTSCGGKETIPLDVHWESSDSSVVRVTPGGNVTGLAPGSALVQGDDHSSYGAGPFEVPVHVVP